MEKRKRRSNGEDGRVELIALLRQTLLEEQLLTSDLKRKLQSAKKENMTLIQQLKNTSLQDQSSPVSQYYNILNVSVVEIEIVLCLSVTIRWLEDTVMVVSSPHLILLLLILLLH